MCMYGPKNNVILGKIESDVREVFNFKDVKNIVGRTKKQSVKYISG